MGNSSSTPCRSDPKMAKATTNSTWKTTLSMSSHESKKEPLGPVSTKDSTESAKRGRKEAKRAEKVANKAAKIEGKQKVKAERARLKGIKKDASKSNHLPSKFQGEI